MSQRHMSQSIILIVLGIALDKNQGDLCDLSIKGVFVHTMMQDSWQFFAEDAGKGTTFALET